MRSVSLLGAGCGLALFFFGMVCVVQAQPSIFEEVAAQIGIVDTLPNGCSVEWYDYDGDGDQDLNFGHRFGSNMFIYRNDGATFTRLGEEIGLLSNWDAGYGGAMDFDHDGDLDLFTRCYHDPSPLLVYENGMFVDHTTQLGLPWETGNRGTLWVDFDRNGWMDILYGHYISGFHLYRNDQGTGFTEITAQSQLSITGEFMEICESDFDLDGDVDLFVTTMETRDFLMVNLGDGIFEDRTEAAGLSAAVGIMDCRWVDFNHDKYPDLLTQGLDRHTIWLNDGDGTFTEMRVHGTVTDFAAQWGAQYSVADFDMDGDYDFYVVRPGGCGVYNADNQFFIQDSLIGLDIYFHDVAPAWGMNFFLNGSSNVADVDGDGDLDLTVSNTGEPLRIYRNNTISNNYLQVHVVGPQGERDRWHTRVEVYQHGTQQIVASSELNRSNVGRNGFDNYFVLNANGHYDLRLFFPCGVTMGPEDYPYLSDVVPAQVNHLITVHMAQPSAVPGSPPVSANTFRLLAAYPNPFNAVTRIDYELAESGSCRLSVYDLTGRHVADLVNGYLPAGTHSAAWNAAAQASGVYLLKLSVGRRSAYQKIVLLK